MKLHKHTWQNDGILCDYHGCYEGRTLYSKHYSVFVNLVGITILFCIIGSPFVLLAWFLSLFFPLSTSILVSAIMFTSFVLFFRRYGEG